MKKEHEYSGLEIAIIGMACRFPGAASPEEFWKNLSNAVESIHYLTEKELTDLGVKESFFKKKNYVNTSSGLKDKDCFDNHFFDYTPVEAKLLNPEHRIFHECVWAALEDAGYDPIHTKDPIGIFAGAGQDLNWRIYATIENNNNDVDDFLLNRINNKDYLASLISYKLDLKGPVFSIQTACSTSLVAIHEACRSLLLGEAKMMLAGGTRLFTNQQTGYLYEEGSVLSKDGRCSAFDDDSSGTFFSEGAGVVVLKRLKDALADNDHIYAIIKGSAINNDGKRKVGYTAPSVEGQIECIRMAQKFAKVQPETIGYVEAHGTGTVLGDPIEVEALNIAFNRNKNKYCALGSVKTNIGHLDAAAGVAGLIKVALSLKYKKIPASLNFNKPSSKIDFEGGPFYVNTQLKDWERNGDIPLRAAVNSLGIGGTNAHIILEEAPEQNSYEEEGIYKLLTTSAKTSDSLTRYWDSLKNVLQQQRSINLADMAYTLQTARTAFEYRKAIIFSDKDELLGKLDAEHENAQINRNDGRDKPIVFMFPGAGSQYVNMGKDLYEKETKFKEEIEKGFRALEEIIGADYLHILYPESDLDLRINDMLYTQPIIFLFEYSLAQLLMSYGVSPTCMIGHSIGEYVAACLSGVFSFEDALKLVVKRGQLMYGMQPGAMVSVALSEREAFKFVSDKISIAAINSVDQVVFSGDALSMDELIGTLERLDIQFVKLFASHAGHSPMIEDIIDEYRSELQQISRNAPEIPFVSNLTGNFITDQEAISIEYWLQHMRKTVRFSQGIQTVLNIHDRNVFVEVGAGHSLVSLLKQHKTSVEQPLYVNLIRSIKEKENDLKYFIGNIGSLWENGVAIDWKGLYKNEKRHKISLPTYSFEKSKFPTEVNPIEKLKTTDPVLLSEVDNNGLKDWIYYPVWKNTALWPASVKKTEKVILFFCDDDQLFTSVKDDVLKRCKCLIQVKTGAGFIKHSNIEYTIDAKVVEQFVGLFAELNKDDIEITDVLYAWNMHVDAKPVQLSEENLNLHLCYLSLVNIAKGLKQGNIISGKRIIVLTNGLHKVIGNETINSGQSLLLGLVNVLPQEYSLSCCNIDINLLEHNNSWVENLVQEIFNNESIHDRIVALRYNQRWVKEYVRNIHPVITDVTAIKKEAVYLITGGLGNVGFILAKYLIQTYNAKLIINGRKALPVSESIDQSKQEWIRRWNYLRSMTNDVIYISADVSDHDVFKEALSDAEGKIGTVQGVIHAAGNINTNDFELVEDITPAKVLNMFSGKVAGLHTIYSIFNNRSIDFVWITSSLASVLAGLSYGSYSSANLYMEHFLSSRSNDLKNWKCVGLGEMVFEDDRIESEKMQKRTSLVPDEIISLFEWSLLIKDGGAIVESAIGLPGRIQKVYGQKKQVYLDTDLREVVKKQRPNLKNKYTPPETETERKLIAMIEEFFGVQDIGIADNFFELGGDSLKAMVLLKRIKKEFNVALRLKEFFTAQNLAQVAKELDNIIWINTDFKAANEIII